MQAIGYFRTNAPPSQSEPVPSQFEFEEAFNEYCDLFFHQPVKTFGDLNASGSDAYPRYKDMVEYIGDSGTNYLIVIPNAGHIGADLESVARSFLELEGIGAKVTCDDEEYPDPLQNAFHILGVTGISKTRSAKIKESMQARALRGKGLGRPPFGYRNGDDGSLTIVKQEAPVVELIFRLYTKDGLGLRLIVQQLNERDIKTRRGGNWNMVSIRDMLRNPAYMGTYSRFGLRLPKAHEPIIPPPVYREAQDTTRSRRPVGRISSAEPFLLSGLAQCGYCGNKMMGVTRRQSWRNKDGKRQRGVYRYYQCQSRNNQSVCGYHTWRAPMLEGAVVSQISLVLQAKSAGIEPEPADDEKPDLQSSWEERVRQAERRFVQAMRRTARGATDVDVLAQYLGELDSTRASAQRAQNPVDAGETLQSWDDLDFDSRRDFLQTHMARVVVNDETVRVET